MNLVLAVVFYGDRAAAASAFRRRSTTIGCVSECVVPATSEQTECDADDPRGPRRGGRAPAGRSHRRASTATPIDDVGTGDRDHPRLAGGPLADRRRARRGASSTSTRDSAAHRAATCSTTTARSRTDAEASRSRSRSASSASAAPPSSVRQPVTAVLPAVGDNIAGVVNDHHPPAAAALDSSTRRSGPRSATRTVRSASSASAGWPARSPASTRHRSPIVRRR